MSNQRNQVADFDQAHPPHVKDVCRELGLPTGCRPVAAQYLQMCITLCNMTGVPSLCDRATQCVRTCPAAAADLAKTMKIPARMSELFADHLVENHGVMRGDNGLLGYRDNLPHTRGFVDKLVSMLPFGRLEGQPLSALETEALGIAQRTGISYGANRTYLLQGLVQIWCFTNFPTAEAASLSQAAVSVFNIVLPCLQWTLTLVWTLFTLFWTHIVIILVLLLTVWLWWLCVKKCLRTIDDYINHWRKARTDRKLFAQKLRNRARNYEEFLTFLKSQIKDQAIRKRMWVEEGFSEYDFAAHFPTQTQDVGHLIPECTHPMAQAPTLPSGTCVQIRSGETVVGCGGVTQLAGDRCTVVTSGHVLAPFLQSCERSLVFVTWDGTSWSTHHHKNPLVTKQKPGAQFAAASFVTDFPEGHPILAWKTKPCNSRQPIHYYRRGVAAEARDPEFCGDRLLYKGDTSPGDSGTVLYQGDSIVALHQGTYSLEQKKNFASIGFDVTLDADPLDDGFAEAVKPTGKAPSGMPKAPRHTRGHAPTQYILKAAAYDGNQFGELLDKAPWSVLYDFGRQQDVLIADSFWYTSAHLLLWKWSDWIKAGKPHNFDLKIFEKIRKEEIMPYLRGKSWDGKLTARVARLIGRVIYPVPEDSGMNATHFAGTDLVGMYERHKISLRDLLILRYLCEHAMKMPAAQWGKIKNLTQAKSSFRQQMVFDEEQGKKVWKKVETTTERKLAEKLEPISKLCTREQFFDKTAALNVYSAALQQGLITEKQIPSILGQFGSREVKRWIESPDVESKEWYLHYVAGLTQLYPESEEQDYDPVETDEVVDEELVEVDDALEMAKPFVLVQPISPPLFREKHAASEEPISIGRFVELEANVKRLTELLESVLSKTDRCTASEPAVKVALFDLASEVAKVGAKTVGKTVADNEVQKPPPKVPVLIYCDPCGKNIPQENWASHEAGIKHQKKINPKKPVQPSIPAALQGALPMVMSDKTPIPECGQPVEALKSPLWHCPTCDVWVMKEKSMAHCSTIEHHARTRGMTVQSFLEESRLTNQRVSQPKYTPPNRRRPAKNYLTDDERDVLEEYRENRSRGWNWRERQTPSQSGQNSGSTQMSARPGPSSDPPSPQGST